MSTETVTPGSQSALRQANRQRVIEAIRESGSLTQAELSRVTGLSAATISNIVRDLRAMGAVSVRPTSAGGRRAREVTLVRRPSVVAALDIGRAHLRVALGDSDGRLLSEESIGYDAASDPGRALRRGAWLVETLLTRARVDRSMVTAVVAAIPGPVSPSGRVGTASILPRWAGVRPADELTHRLGVPIHVENDANLCAFAEHTEGAARGAEHAIYINLTHGVGAGILVSGELYRGTGGTAGEIGHIALDERGQVCRCGNRGCLETLAGEPYLVGMLPQHLSADRRATLRAIIDGAREADPGCRRIIAEAGLALGRGTAMLVNLFNPRLVVVGGELAQAGELLLEPMRGELELRTLDSAFEDMHLVVGALGARAVVRGALAYALACAPQA